MTESKLDLWKKLEDFNIDAGDERLTFARRLARENGWSAGFAERVLLEYKRFVFLCCEAGHACTPSDHVDQAWHLHLTYTQSYWEEMCQKVLPRPLHHNPTKGGATEDTKFDDWYARTLESYDRLFGHTPPTDIWPSSEQRFGVDPYAQRVNLVRFWVIPKQPVKRVALSGALLIVMLAAAGCSDDPGTALALILAVATVVSLIILAVMGMRSRPNNGEGGAGGGFFGGSGCGTGGDSGHSGSGCGSGCSGSSGCGGGGCGGGGCGGGGCSGG